MAEYRLHLRGTLFPIRGGEVILGRSSYASIVVNNPMASREHALVRSVAGRLEVTDLGSKNGTFLNGRRLVGTQPLAAGDRIKIGADELEISAMSERDPGAFKVVTQPGRGPSEPLRATEETTSSGEDSDDEEDTTASNTRRPLE
ncbi:MAG: FHA domain-containing protein, partial [Thermoanaerobaculia bacterium]